MFKSYFPLFLLSVLASVIHIHNIKPTTVKPTSGILSKFHQIDYKIDFERIELKRVNESFGEFHMRTFKYNRTTPVANGTFIFNVHLGYKLKLYKFASNEYRLFPLRCQINLCEAIATSALGLDIFYKLGNFVYPLTKGTKYYFYNFAPDESKFPPFIPSGRYMLELQLVFNSEEVLVANSYASVYRPIV